MGRDHIYIYIHIHMYIFFFLLAPLRSFWRWSRKEYYIYIPPRQSMVSTSHWAIPAEFLQEPSLRINNRINRFLIDSFRNNHPKSYE